MTRQTLPRPVVRFDADKTEWQLIEWQARGLFRRQAVPVIVGRATVYMGRPDGWVVMRSGESPEQPFVFWPDPSTVFVWGSEKAAAEAVMANGDGQPWAVCPMRELTRYVLRTL
ncbi:hypothetical protein [Saccharopolyspora elongata]|uniref:Uncharacterized protein n=1 Tax=Saccharopolyspora elongata TaxID=2530387 RepID=A0A4R4Y9Z1_9PSEU|nr:hypothetical protein [Saccharopolyspora elongata]TDD41358.1 hypothetical protein E1288_32795 [Saccharopolyspora elongata]